MRQVSVTLPPSPNNGHTIAPPLSAVTLGWLGTSIDKLAELRAEKRRLETAERTLTGEILAIMTRHGLPALRASHAVAMVGQRTELTVDPELFVTAVGLPAAASALRVLIEPARRLLGEADLTAIAEARTTPVLRIDALRPDSATA